MATFRNGNRQVAYRNGNRQVAYRNGVLVIGESFTPTPTTHTLTVGENTGLGAIGFLDGSIGDLTPTDLDGQNIITLGSTWELGITWLNDFISNFYGETPWNSVRILKLNGSGEVISSTIFYRSGGSGYVTSTPPPFLTIPEVGSVIPLNIAAEVDPNVLSPVLTVGIDTDGLYGFNAPEGVGSLTPNDGYDSNPITLMAGNNVNDFRLQVSLGKPHDYFDTFSIYEVGVQTLVVELRYQDSDITANPRAYWQFHTTIQLDPIKTYQVFMYRLPPPSTAVLTSENISDGSVGFNRALNGGDLVPDNALNGDKIIRMTNHLDGGGFRIFTFALDNSSVPQDYFYKINIIDSTGEEVGMRMYSSSATYSLGVWTWNWPWSEIYPSETYTFEIYYDQH